LGALLALIALAPGWAAGAHGKRHHKVNVCDRTVSSVSAAQSAVRQVAGGSIVCLTDGTYGEVTLSASKSSNTILRAEHPGRATIDGATLSGKHLGVARFNITDQVEVLPGSSQMLIQFNRITDGYFGVSAGPTTDTNISDTTIRNNQFVGPYGEDAIRLNRYHDGPDANPWGVLIQENEFTNIRENGNHSDCLQSVWGGDGLYFDRNYLHDNRCQGFFVKDQPTAVADIVVRQNLMVRNGADCDPPGSGCGQPAYWHVFGPTDRIRAVHNTIWTSSTLFALREGPWGTISIKDNVLYRVWSDWGGGWPAYTESSNTVCKREGTIPPLSSSTTRTCSPAFMNPAADDYRLKAPRDDGVSWRPSSQEYGP
jgi:hypothetical protein